MTKNSLVPYVETAMNTVKPDLDQFFNMLSFRRKEGSSTQKGFCRKFLEPVFGRPDRFGNYMKVVGDNPSVAFMAHHDTVHTLEGQQPLEFSGQWVQLPTASRSNCLGADCTSGVWLILHMIKNNIPGRYIIHAGEEIGMVGAKALVRHQLSPDCVGKDYWLDSTNFAISFDRKGYKSIITHQMGYRTASDKFADSLNKALGGGFEKDDGGAYTDSEAYAEYISECTNLSVGYFWQHSSHEVQNIPFLEELARKLVAADWGQLVCDRDVNDYDYSYPFSCRSNYNYSTSSGKEYSTFKSRFDTSMEEGKKANYVDTGWNDLIEHEKDLPLVPATDLTVKTAPPSPVRPLVQKETKAYVSENGKLVDLEQQRILKKAKIEQGFSLLCWNHPDKIAKFLVAQGYSVDDVRDEIGLNEILRGYDDVDW